MIKRPLGTLCLMIVGIIFLMTELSGKKETEDICFPKGELWITGTVYKKDLSGTEDGVTLYLKDVMFEDIVASEEAFIPDGEAPESVICYLSSVSKEPKIGSRIRIRGYPSGFDKATNPGQFDMKFYYRILGISFRLSKAYVLAESISYSRFREGLYRLRCQMAAQLDACLSEEDAGVMKTMLLGTKGTLDEELKALYQRNGIAHILAISGLHISLLGMGTYSLLRRLGLPVGAGALAAAVLMFCYGVMTGFSVSMLRAVIMFLLHMLAKIVGRTYDMLTATGVAAVLILIEQPLYLYYGGFIFSFGCVVGIGLVLPALTETKLSLPGPQKILLSGAAMAVISYPMYLWFYYQFPPYSILLNLFVVPLMSFLMAAGPVLLCLRIFCPGLAYLAVFLIHGILKIYQISCNICDRLPGHVFTPGKPQTWQLLVYLAVLVALVFLHAFRKNRIPLKLRWSAVLVGLVLLSIRPWNALELTFLDVGQGDCIYIKSRTGTCYLIDGGSTSVSSVGKYRIIPFLKYKGAGELEAIIVTHPDEDHINGILELLDEGQVQGIQVKNLVLPEIKEELKNASYKELELAAEKEGILISYIRAGEGITDAGMTMRCINPRQGEVYLEPNEYSVVLELSEGNFSALLTGDAEGVGESVILEELAGRKSREPVTVLKAAHHGSRYSTPEELLKVIEPQVTVISCGKDNPYGHPHEETLKRLAEAGTKVLETPRYGAVTITVRENAEIKGWLTSG